MIGQNFGDGRGRQERQAGDEERQPGHQRRIRATSRPGPRRPSRQTTPLRRRSRTSGPNSKATLTEISGNIQAYIGLNGKYYPGGLTAAKVPVDAANSSASGIDPDISVGNADIQAYRIAAVRRIPFTAVTKLVSRYTHGRGLGFAGEPGVDVLELNLALDRV